jgi:hypothetical protein
VQPRLVHRLTQGLPLELARNVGASLSTGRRPDLSALALAAAGAHSKHENAQVALVTAKGAAGGLGGARLPGGDVAVPRR